MAEVEVTRERDLEALADPERAVGLDLDRDVGREEREAVGASQAGQGQSSPDNDRQR